MLVAAPHPYAALTSAPEVVMAALQEAHAHERAAAAEHRRMLAEHHRRYAGGGGLARARAQAAGQATAGVVRDSAHLAVTKQKMERAHRALLGARLHLAIARSGHRTATERRDALLARMQAAQRTGDRTQVEEAQDTSERLPGLAYSAHAARANALLRAGAGIQDTQHEQDYAASAEARSARAQDQVAGAGSALHRLSGALPELRPGLWSLKGDKALLDLCGPQDPDEHRAAYDALESAFMARLPRTLRAGAPRFLARALASWRTSTTGASAGALALQLAAADLLGAPDLARAALPGAPHPQETLRVPAHSVPERPGHTHDADVLAYDHARAALADPEGGLLWRAVCAVLYQLTHERLDAAGIGHLTLYRPLVYPTRESAPFEVRRALLVGEAEVHLHPLSSWTADLSVALARAGDTDGEQAQADVPAPTGAYGVLLSVELAASSVFALGAATLCDARAREVVLAAGRGTAAIKEARAFGAQLPAAPDR
jgi:hypothetical protein